MYVCVYMYVSIHVYLCVCVCVCVCVYENTRTFSKNGGGWFEALNICSQQWFLSHRKSYTEECNADFQMPLVG